MHRRVGGCFIKCASNGFKHLKQVALDWVRRLRRYSKRVLEEWKGVGREVIEVGLDQDGSKFIGLVNKV